VALRIFLSGEIRAGVGREPATGAKVGEHSLGPWDGVGLAIGPTGVVSGREPAGRGTGRRAGSGRPVTFLGSACWVELRPGWAEEWLGRGSRQGQPHR
jgi:hypothetical protein